MKYCPYCGAGLQDEMIFCPLCGKRYASAQNAADDVPADISEPSFTEAPAELADKAPTQEINLPSSQDIETAYNVLGGGAVDSSEQLTEKKPPKTKTSLWPPILIGAAILVGALFLLFFNQKPSEDAGVPSPVLEARGSVVRIIAEYTDSTASGSGFIIANNGRDTFVATNAHVVEDDPYSIAIWTDSGKVSADIYEFTKNKDLCILRLAYPIKGAALRLSPGTVKQGDPVYAVGFPGAADDFSDTAAHKGEEATITDGIVSAIRNVTLTHYGASVELLQMNAAINHGNSGGPLFDTQGRVVGVSTYGAVDSQGIFGAISVSELIPLMTQKNIPANTEGNTFSAGPWIAATVIGMAGIALLVILAFKRQKKRMTPKKSDVDLEERRPKRRVGAIVSSAVLILVLIGVGTFGGLYWAASEYANREDFTTAGKYLVFPQMVEKFDPLLPAYINAGIQMENRQYADALSAFHSLQNKEYRNATELWNNCKYMRALQLADDEEWWAAKAFMQKLADIDYKDSKEQVNKLAYREANYIFYEKHYYYEAYVKFQELANRGYAPAKHSLDLVAEFVYYAMQDAYRNAEYFEALKLSSLIPDYLDTWKYKTLLCAKSVSLFFPEKSSSSHLLIYAKNRTELEKYGYPSISAERDEKTDVTALISIFEFEDAADILLSENLYAIAFLEGTWKTSDGYYFFTMKNNGLTSYNLPWFDYGDYYEIADGTYFLYLESDPTNRRALYTFIPITANCLDIYCHKNGRTYTVYRQ